MLSQKLNLLYTTGPSLLLEQAQSHPRTFAFKVSPPLSGMISSNLYDSLLYFLDIFVYAIISCQKEDSSYHTT